MDNDYKYDIAFSFLKKDQQIIEQLFLLLKDKVKCFVYFNEQEKLAGRNGENVFNNVFAIEARMIVVAYDDEWGETPWTRVEETAIRNRAHDEGYDFVTLMPVKSGLQAPKWLPKNRIWLGLETYGIEKAAIVLESRVQELFGEVKQLSAQDIIIQEAELIEIRTINKKRIQSLEGVKILSEEYEKFKIIFNEKYENLKNKLPNWHLKIFENNMRGHSVYSYGHTLFFYKIQPYSNTAENAGIKICIWDGYIKSNMRKTDPFYEYKEIHKIEYFISLNNFNEAVWIADEKEISTEKLIDDILLKFFTESKKYKN
jgi:hypothetical protein